MTEYQAKNSPRPAGMGHWKGSKYPLFSLAPMLDGGEYQGLRGVGRGLSQLCHTKN